MLTYFLLSAGKVKIGKTTDLDRRLREYKTHNPDFTFIASIEGDVEKEIHQALHNKRSEGEWFYITPDEAHEIVHFFRLRKQRYLDIYFDLPLTVHESIREVAAVASRVLIGDQSIDLTFKYPIHVYRIG